MALSFRIRISLAVMVVMTVAGAGLWLSRGRATKGVGPDDSIRTLRPQQAAPSGITEKGARLALIIGNGAYAEAPLRNPVNDAKAMKEALEGCEFEVTLKVNASKREMEEAIQTFGDRILGGAVGLFYYAGHGVAVKGANYLIPVDAKISREDDVPYEGVDVGRVLDKMDTARNQLNILILDACRNNPFARSWRSSTKGLVQVSAPKGSLIAYATAPGSTAADGHGDHGLYTEALLVKLKEPGVSLLDVFQDVRAEVESRSQGQQIPWESNSTVGRFYFRPVEASSMRPASSPVVGQPSKVTSGSQSPMSDTPPVPGATRSTAGMWVAQLDIGLAQHAGFNAWFRRIRASKDQLRVKLHLVQIPPGQFRREQDGIGPRDIQISQAFWMGKFPVTQMQWESVMEKNPSAFPQVGPDGPVEMVSWDDIHQFLARLNAMQDTWTFRLPTRAEMELACRAGTKEDPYGPIDAIAWHAGNSGSTTHPVGQKQPNAFGLHDMLGNVVQWCQDRYDASKPEVAQSGPQRDPQGDLTGHHRFTYGSSWRSPATDLRFSYGVFSFPYVYSDESGVRYDGIGFRGNVYSDSTGFRVCAMPRLPN